MNVYGTKQIRNVVLLGHGGAGKTTLVESMALVTGVTKRMGNVVDGSTISDYDKEEIKRQFSISTSLVPLEFQGEDGPIKVNLLDTPGYFDFVGEAEEAISVADAAVIVVTAGVGQKPGETRIDLVHRNVEVFRGIMGEIRARDCGGILLVVSNPVDILTYAAIRLSGLPEDRVIGSGTVLDTARLKQIIGDRLEVDPRNVHARILGEHGDSEIIAWSSAHVAGIPLEDFFNMRAEGSYADFRDEMSDLVRNAAYEIIRRKRATYYGIALSVKRICEAIVRDEKSVLSVSNMLHGEFGIEGVALSTPCIVGRAGIEGRMPPSLNYAEQQSLKESAALLREVIDEIALEDAGA